MLNHKSFWNIMERSSVIFITDHAKLLSSHKFAFVWSFYINIGVSLELKIEAEVYFGQIVWIFHVLLENSLSWSSFSGIKPSY